MKKTKLFLSILVLLAVGITGWCVINNQEQKENDNFSENLEALSHPVEETKYFEITWTTKGTPWEDSLYTYSPYTIQTNCMSGGNEDCIPAKEKHVIKTNKKTLTSTDEICK